MNIYTPIVIPLRLSIASMSFILIGKSNPLRSNSLTNGYIRLTRPALSSTGCLHSSTAHLKHWVSPCKHGPSKAHLIFILNVNNSLLFSY